jgi:acyl dehydratase
MEVNPDVVGTELNPITLQISARRIMSYSAGVGDSSSMYLEDSRPGGIYAHPMFPVSLTWPMAGDLQRALGDGLPKGAVSRMVHATEHLLLLRPIRANQTITISGVVAAVQPRSAGTLLVMRYELRDEKKIVLSIEHSGAILRGVSCNSNGRELPDTPMEVIPQQENLAPEWRDVIEISPQAAHVYDACSDIHFPIHTSTTFAKAVGLPGIIMQGTATLAMCVSRLVDRFADGDPSQVRSVGCRFIGMVRPGESIHLEGTNSGCFQHFSANSTDGKAVLLSKLELCR